MSEDRVVQFPQKRARQRRRPAGRGRRRSRFPLLVVGASVAGFLGWRALGAPVLDSGVGIVPAGIASEPARGLTGRASVIDGDTIEIAGQRIRFHGVDAPESRQSCRDARGREYRCGTIAANALDDWLAQSRPTRCEERDVDRYKRVVAQCFRADGAEVNAWLVRNGYALDWPRYSQGAYAAEQRQAQTALAGMWQGEFEKPWEWRRR